jgi:hypothetical protein
MNKLVVRRGAGYRLYVENPQTINATYILSFIDETGVQRSQCSAEMAAHLVEVDQNRFAELMRLNLFTSMVFRDYGYDEIIFPR